MHAQNIVHCDLKLENTLIDDNFTLKLVDFGYSSYKNIDCINQILGTFAYMAPEIKEEKIFKGT